MSDYLRKTKNPRTGEFEVAEWLDDYYGKHRYGVRFPSDNGEVRPADGRDWEFADESSLGRVCEACGGSGYKTTFPHSALEFGADPTGFLDSAPALQAAIDAQTRGDGRDVRCQTCKGTGRVEDTNG